MAGRYQESSYDSKLQSSGSSSRNTKARTVQYGLMDGLQALKAGTKSSPEEDLESLHLLSLMIHIVTPGTPIGSVGYPQRPCFSVGVLVGMNTNAGIMIEIEDLAALLVYKEYY